MHSTTIVPTVCRSRAARVAAGVAVCIAGYFGINPPGFVAQVVAFAFGLAASSFFPAIIMGIFSRRMNREGAITGMIAGITFTAGYIVWFKFLHPELNSADHWWWGRWPWPSCSWWAPGSCSGASWPCGTSIRGSSPPA